MRLQDCYCFNFQLSDMNYQGGYFDFALPAPTLSLARLFTDIKTMQRDNLSDMPVQSKDDRNDEQIKGLKFIAKKIKILLEKNKRIEYNEASRILINNFASEEKAERNIKRRVYDAINVLVSAGVIWKDDNKIQLLLERKQARKNGGGTAGKITKEGLLQQCAQAQNRIESKKKRVKELLIKQAFLRKIIAEKQKKSKKQKDSQNASQESFIIPWQGQINQVSITRKKKTIITIKGGKSIQKIQPLASYFSTK